MDQNIAGILGSAILAFIPAIIAREKGRSFGLWWLYGFLLFIVALIHSILMKPIKQCAYCGKNIHKEYTLCPYCGKRQPYNLNRKDELIG